MMFLFSFINVTRFRFTFLLKVDKVFYVKILEIK